MVFEALISLSVANTGSYISTGRMLLLKSDAQLELESLENLVIAIQDTFACTALSTNSGEFPYRTTPYIK